MARWDVGGFTTASTAAVTAVGIPPVSLLALAVPDASPNTTLDQAVVGVGLARSTAEQVGVGFSGFFAASSAQYLSTVETTGVFALSNGLNFTPANQLTSATVGRVTAGSPAGFAVLAGDEVAAKVASGSISTLVSTQASTGYGFAPNAAIILGQSLVTSVANMSVGFACQTSAGGPIKQWSIDQAGRKAANANAHRAASSVSALKLHTTASTAHDVAVTSFRSDGLELTVNATDTARAATVSVLGLSVPKVDAGKATITTNGVGVGQTGITVTGLGPQVGLVILASIGSSAQTLQAHNMFSVGFASSNNNQRSVAGFVTDGGGATTRYASYFNTTGAVTFVSGSSNVHVAITNPPALLSAGVFAVTTDGFTVTFNNTNANGWDIYWGAFMNVVSDIGGAVAMATTVKSGLKEVDHLGGQSQSSFGVNSGLVEVGHIGGAAQMAFTAAMGLTPDFFPGEGKLHADSLVRIYADKDHKGGFGVGNEEATERFLYKIANSSSPDLERSYDITTAPTRLGVAEFGNANALVILPPSSNTHPMRMGAGRTSPGLPLSSRGMSVLALADRAGSDVYLFTTASGSTIHGVRVLLR